MQPRDKLRAALARGPSADNGSAAKDKPALVAFVTAGYPEPSEFLNVLRAVASAADAVEIGVPFSDPMADGVTIQRSSQHAIERGVSLQWILDELARRDYELAAPVLLMSYLNPLLAFGGDSASGYDSLVARAAEVGVSGVIVPDLPYEESAPLRAALEPAGLGARAARDTRDAGGALAHALRREPGVRVRGDAHRDHGRRVDAAGGDRAVPRAGKGRRVATAGVRRVSACAAPEQVATIARHADGVIVGSALVEVLERHEDPARFLRSLRGSYDAITNDPLVDDQRPRACR